MSRGNREAVITPRGAVLSPRTCRPPVCRIMNSNDNHSHTKRKGFIRKQRGNSLRRNSSERANGGDGQCSVAAGQDFVGGCRVDIRHWSIEVLDQ